MERRKRFLAMKCAQCEKAEATRRCVDEDLHFCDRCCVLLHKKKARRHHEIQPGRASLVCDECEEASAEVECFQCGGGKTALAFCLSCSDSLHSRVARAGHHVGLINRLEKKAGTEKSVGGRIVIDLTDLDSDEESQTKLHQKKETVSGSTAAVKACVKEEAKEADSKSKVLGMSTNGRDIPDISSAKKSRRTVHRKKSVPSEEARRRQITIASLIKLEDDNTVKENSPEKEQRRTRGRTLPVKEELSESQRDSSSSSDSDQNESDDELGGVHRIKRGSVSLEAFVVDADDADDGPSGAVPDDKVEVGIKKRIKNMLELGLHPDTPEFEAQQALKNAQRLLTKHNLQQAEVLKGTLADTSSLVGGMRVVELRAKGKVKQGRMDAWVQELGWVIADNFDCQYFFKTGTSSKPLRVVFYGISHNADCAGYAFAATYNRISTLAAEYVACKKSLDDEKENQASKDQQVNAGIYTRVARTSYRKGVVAGLKEAVNNAQRNRNEDVLGDERTEMTGAESCSDTDESASNKIDGQDSCLSTRGPRLTYKGDYNDDHKNSTRLAERCMAITALVLHSQNVGDEFLKQKGIKVRKRTIQRRVASWNGEAFRQGKRDSAVIDINQKSITGAKVKKSRGSAK